MVTNNLDNVKEHMNKSHNLKVESDLLSRKCPCSLCSFTTTNINDLKNHIINVHKKDKHNWMVEDITAEFTCDECDIKFSRKSELEIHMNRIHAGDRGHIKVLTEVKTESNVRPSAKRKIMTTSSTLTTIDEIYDIYETQQDNIKTEEHKDYTKTMHDADEPNLITIRGINQSFLDARKKIARVIRRGNLKTNGLKVNGVQFKVLNMQDKQFSTEADIETVNEQGEKGKSKLTIYKDNKKKAGKKEQTIMISKKARYEAKHVKTLTTNVIQYLLEGFMTNQLKEEDGMTNSETPKVDFKCDGSKKTFDTKQELPHATNTCTTTFKCEECGEEKSTSEALDAHKELQHTKKQIKENLIPI